MIALLTTLGFVEAGVLAGWLLRRAWRLRTGWKHNVFLLSGWLVLLGSLALGAGRFDLLLGVFVALPLVSIGALALVATGFEWRRARIRREREDIALEPSDRASRAWRGWLRALLAGPLGGVAAMGIGLAWAVFAPGDAQTRIVTGGLLVPLLWAGGMAWTLSDDKILRATAVLAGVAIITFAASALRGFA
ncbi:MAG: hypothetical protein QM759_08550 [Terricaulis sp.]